MTGSIAPNRPGHHGTLVARTVGTVAISCNGSQLSTIVSRTGRGTYFFMRQYRQAVLLKYS